MRLFLITMFPMSLHQLALYKYHETSFYYWIAWKDGLKPKSNEVARANTDCDGFGIKTQEDE